MWMHVLIVGQEALKHVETSWIIGFFSGSLTVQEIDQVMQKLYDLFVRNKQRTGRGGVRTEKKRRCCQCLLQCRLSLVRGWDTEQCVCISQHVAYKEGGTGGSSITTLNEWVQMNPKSAGFSSLSEPPFFLSRLALFCCCHSVFLCLPPPVTSSLQQGFCFSRPFTFFFSTVILWALVTLLVESSDGSVWRSVQHAWSWLWYWCSDRVIYCIACQSALWMCNSLTLNYDCTVNRTLFEIGYLASLLDFQTARACKGFFFGWGGGVSSSMRQRCLSLLNNLVCCCTLQVELDILHICIWFYIVSKVYTVFYFYQTLLRCAVFFWCWWC